MLEKMADFFDRRLDEYDDHQLSCIESAREFLLYTAEHLPAFPECKVLDLGCGTGLELENYFHLNPSAKVTGIDLAPGMLGRLREKFRDKDMELICGSYFDVPFGREIYDAAVSVESLHHFTAEQKVPLYRKVRQALKPGGYFILTDYFAPSDREEVEYRRELLRLMEEQGIRDQEFYHYDTPLTVAHETECLKAVGFSSVIPLKNWSATHTLKAVR